MMDDQDKILSDVGEAILAALKTVSEAAQQALSEAHAGIPTTMLANPSNTMVGEGKAEKSIDAINSTNRENLRRLLREPFVARVEVDWVGEGAQSPKTYYFSRPSAAGLVGTIPDAQHVTAGAVLGRLAEYEAGDSASVEIGGRRREVHILRRTVFHPAQRDGLWDALVKKFEAM